MKKTIISALLGLSLLPLCTNAAIDSSDKKEIEKIVREYLLENPQLIVEVMQNLERKEMEKAESNIPTVVKKVLASDDLPSIGKKGAKHYIIEFFDYNCGYCKVMEPYFKKAIEEFDLRIVYVNIPVIKRESEQLAVFGQAIYNIDKKKYFAYPDYSMKPGNKGASTDVLKAVCEEIGINFDDVLAELKTMKAQETVRDSMETSQLLNIRGTPYLIIDGKEYRGAITSYEILSKILNQ